MTNSLKVRAAATLLHGNLPRQPYRLTSMSSVPRKLVIGLFVMLFVASCTHQSDDTGTDRSSGNTPTQIHSSPVTTAVDQSVLRIQRELPQGPIFIEGSAAHARITDSSGAVVLERYFDVPQVPGASDRFPRQIRVELPPGRYRVEIVQHPCDGSACSAGGPDEWGEARLRCEVPVRLSGQQVFTLTAVVRPAGCRIAQESTLGQTGK